MSQAARCASLSDPELVQACLRGDEPAWKELVERYSRLVYSIALRCGLTAADADDVFQNVFVIVHRRLNTLKDQQLLAPWLITVTLREAKRMMRHLPHHSELDDSAPNGAEPPIDQVHRWEQQHLVRQALGQMDPRCREILTTLFLDATPASYQELAARIGVTSGSIGPTRARCIKKLEALLLSLGIDLDD